MNVVLEALKALAKSREQSRESSYFEALPKPKGRGAYFQLKHHAKTVLHSLHSIFNINKSTRNE